jgi:alanine racemase
MACIQINKQRFFSNLDIVARHIDGKEKIAIVLKDNAYGHGIDIISKLACSYGITRAYVRTMQEAKAIQDHFKQVSVLQEIPKSLPPHGTVIVLNSLEQIARTPNSAHVEIKVDTGMHRNGIQPDMLDRAFELMQKRRLTLCGVLTHFRSSGDLGSEFFWQQKQFDSVKQRVRQICQYHNIAIPLFHSCNSSATFRNQTCSDDFVRIGLAAYGYLESDLIFNPPALMPVMSLWADKVVTHRLGAGKKIGYGGASRLENDTTLSTYDVGYGDGLFRFTEAHHYTTPSGQTVLPRMSMDYTTITGEENSVCLFNDVRPLAKLFQTISYDVLVKLKAHIARRVV